MISSVEKSDLTEGLWGLWRADTTEAGRSWPGCKRCKTRRMSNVECQMSNVESRRLVIRVQSVSHRVIAVIAQNPTIRMMTLLHSPLSRASSRLMTRWPDLVTDLVIRGHRCGTCTIRYDLGGGVLYSVPRTIHVATAVPKPKNRKMVVTIATQCVIRSFLPSFLAPSFPVSLLPSFSLSLCSLSPSQLLLIT